MFENIKNYLDSFEKMGIPTCDILVYKDGKEVFRETRGSCDDFGSPVTEDLLFNIYSNSKFITVVSALTLFEQGKFCLDDCVADYIPAFKDVKVYKNGILDKPERQMTIKNLFTMTSGMTYDYGSEQIKQGVIETEGKAPTVKMMDYLAKMPLAFSPDDEWNYSLSHDVLAGLIEIISGKRFGEYVKERIFKPFNIADFTFNLPEEKLSKVCKQFDHGTNGFMPVDRTIQRYKFGTEYESGGAGGVCTVNAYMKFLEAFRTGKLLKEETMALMMQDHLSESQKKTFWGSKGYSYGLGVRVPDCSNKRTDIGWGGAAGAFAAVDFKNNISLYYAQHVLNSPNRNLRKDIIEAVKLDLGCEAFVEDMNVGTGSFLA
ncbi:MAG: beta-lactamase family protein [Clostridiales bacterium]|nr:beta-lactamase family protein [Clostridiales bacterium]